MRGDCIMFETGQFSLRCSKRSLTPLCRILHHNRLTGPVPSAIPAALPTRLRYLRMVDLSSNQLTGTLSSPKGGSQDGFGILHLHSL